MNEQEKPSRLALAATAVRLLAVDGMALAGLAAIAWGFSLLHPAAGWIVGGIEAAGIAVLVRRGMKETT